jgi:hypothetical protein
MVVTTLSKLAAATLALLLLSISAAQAQTDATADEVSTTTTQTERWFEVEQISGDPLVGDFVVGPGRSEIRLEPGQTFVQEITVTNRLSDNRTFALEVEDITGSIDGSSAVSLTGDDVGPFSIRDYITFPEDTFELALGQRARIPITVSVPPNAEPGGYYGSVLVSTVTENDPEADGSAASSAIIARVGSLFFVTIAGEELREGETQAVSTVGKQTFYQSGPIDFAILFENTGTVHTNPYGEISITNMFGEDVGFIEMEPWFVLPQSLRSREVSWNREFLLGRYEVTARINRGYDDIVDEVTTSFWVIPYTLVGGVFLILFIFIFLFRFITKNFEFKRKPANTNLED